jgi:hypothetical protein
VIREASCADVDVIQARMRSVPGFRDEGWRHVALVHLDGERIDGCLAARGSLVIAGVWRDAETFSRAQGWTPPAAILLRKRLAVDVRAT